MARTATGRSCSSGPGVARTDTSKSSIMDEVRARICNAMEEPITIVSSFREQILGGKMPSAPELASMALRSPRDEPSWAKVQKETTHRTNCTGRSRSEKATTARDARSHSPRSRRSRAVSGDGPFENRFTVSFRMAVIAAITIAVMLSCTGMYVPLEVFTNLIKEETDYSCQKAVKKQRKLIDELVMENVTRESYKRLLGTISTTVRRYVRSPPDEALDSLMSTLMTWHKFDEDWTGRTPAEREHIEYAAWTILSGQWSSDRRVGDDWPAQHRGDFQWRKPHAEWLYVGFDDEAVAGVLLDRDAFNASAFNATGGEFYMASLFMDAEASGAGVDSELEYWRVNADGDHMDSQPKRHHPYLASGRPYYKVQQTLLERAEREPGGPESVPAERAWSDLYDFVDGDIGFSWTAPLAYCGNYSCFAGVIASDITLKYVSLDCTGQWRKLQQRLASKAFEYFHIGSHNSSVFIVNHYSERNRTQQGLLVGASHDDADDRDSGLVQADESTHRIVRDTSNALLERFSSWDAPELQQQQLITYKRDLIQQSPPVFKECGKNSVENTTTDDTTCVQVGTMSVELDSGTRWLLVAVMPLGAFSKKAVKTVVGVDEELNQTSRRSQEYVDKARATGVLIFVGMTAVSVSLGFGLGFLVSQPLRKLSKLMRRLGDLDFAHETREFAELRSGQRSRIRDVSKLQRTFCSLSRGIEAFARFVPETVVRNIVRGDQRATRLHVSRRQVTIMFSDIRDFTSISEKMTQRDLLFVLTRYFSVMTRIVELFEGVVAEILGDGLLIFWNTPHSVEDHAGKACAAALAQQKALHLLNEELARLRLPQLAIRIGLHTGDALSGNIGSDTKMKFGCLGEPVNLANRLEGLCKHYGVGILCSQATFDALPPSAGFLCRKLDLVQVKGKMEATAIYEVIGREQESDEPLPAAPRKHSSKPASAFDGGGCGHSPPPPPTSLLGPPGQGAAGGVDLEVGMASDGRAKDRRSTGSTAGSDRKRERLARAASGLSAVLTEPVSRLARQCLRGSATPSSCAATASPPALPAGASAPAFPGQTCSTQLPTDTTVCAESRRRAVQYELALAEFQRARFGEALSLAQTLLEEEPGDVATQRLCERAKRHAEQGLSEEELAVWTGVLSMTDK